MQAKIIDPVQPKKFTLLICCWACASISLMAQVSGRGYVETGSTNVSDGLTLKTATMVHAGSGKYGIEAGLQVDLISHQRSILSGYSLAVSRDFLLKDHAFQLQGFFLRTPYNMLLNETNTGLLAETAWNHFSLQLGNEFRTFSFTREAVDTYHFREEERIRENWNLVYYFGYRIKTEEDLWNLEFAITNRDHFLINQETNPFFRVHGQYSILKSMDLYMEMGYKSAGAFNLSVNYFGFFIRAGITWEIL